MAVSSTPQMTVPQRESSGFFMVLPVPTVAATKMKSAGKNFA